MTRPARLAIAISILAIAVRVIWINQPIIDNWSWRQSDVAAIARNYFTGGFHFTRPQIDWAGDQPGYVGTEFPILPFIAALFYKLIGVHEWIGRSQSLLLFAASLPFFFLLMRKFFAETAAVWALLFYAFAPIGIMASRSFMPDIPSLALSIIGLYLFQEWLESQKSSAFIISAICISLSILIKATSVIIAVPVLCLAFRHFGVSVFHRVRMWIFAAIALIPSVIWYWYAYQISLKFYPHHFFGAGGVQIMSFAWYLKIATLLITSTLTPLLFVLGLGGAAITRSNPRGRAFHCWLVAMILFMIVVGYGNRHQWYQLPLIPIFAALGGAACAFFAEKIANRSLKISFSIAIVIIFLILSGRYAREFYRPSGAPLRDVGLQIKASLPNALVIASDNGDPTLLYYAECKGWHFMEKDGIYDGEPRDSAQAIADLELLKTRGARYLVFTLNTAWWIDYYSEFGQHVAATATLVKATPEFRIYDLNPK